MQESTYTQPRHQVPSPKLGRFYTRRKPPVLILQEAEWTPGPVWTESSEEISTLLTPGTKPGSSGPQPRACRLYYLAHILRNFKSRRMRMKLKEKKQTQLIKVQLDQSQKISISTMIIKKITMEGASTIHAERAGKARYWSISRKNKEKQQQKRKEVEKQEDQGKTNMRSRIRRGGMYKKKKVDPFGPVVIILATRSQVRVFKPGWGRWIF